MSTKDSVTFFAISGSSAKKSKCFFFFHYIWTQQTERYTVTHFITRFLFTPMFSILFSNVLQCINICIIMTNNEIILQKFTCSRSAIAALEKDMKQLTSYLFQLTRKTPERRVLISYPLKFFLVFSGGIKWGQVVPVS